MNMWDHLTPRNLIDAQRDMTVREMGERAAALYEEGYAVEADRVLDEMNERREAWNQEAA